MPTIRLKTEIHAPIKRCFDLSRSIDLHLASTAQTKEQAIAGVTSGLIGLGESVTWKAKHFGVWQTLTSKITAFDSPHYFADEQVAGIFASFKHEHIFTEQQSGITQMEDVFHYISPLGLLGKLADMLFLEQYLKRFLKERNEIIQQSAESDNWAIFLPDDSENQ